MEVTFWFDGRYRIDLVLTLDCRSVSIRGLTVDYDPMCFAQGPVAAINEAMRTVDTRIVLRDNKVSRPTKRCRGDAGLGKWAEEKTVQSLPP